MEEFYESDVLWAADDHLVHRVSEAAAASNACSSRERMSTSTGPVDIPAASYRSSREHPSDDYVVRGRNGKTVPPHELVSQSRMARTVAFSLCSGHGRTLKWRELRRVRGSVLRMTGFIEG